MSDEKLMTTCALLVWNGLLTEGLRIYWEGLASPTQLIHSDDISLLIPGVCTTNQISPSPSPSPSLGASAVSLVVQDFPRWCVVPT